MAAYADAIQSCDTEVAPWHIVPSGRKWYRNWAITALLVEALEEMALRWPEPAFDVDEQRRRLLAMPALLARPPGRRSVPDAGHARDLGDRRASLADLLEAVLAQAAHAVAHGDLGHARRPTPARWPACGSRRSPSSPRRGRCGPCSRCRRSARSRPARRPRGRRRSAKPWSRSTSAGMIVRRLQCWHSVRARRWATTQSIALATRNGSMPISIRRVSAVGASLVCSVESTRWPVSAASTAICAVSRSRISPTMITSGSARIIARRPLAKVSPAFGLTWTCVTPVDLALDRVLDGDDVLLGRVDLAERGVQRRRLARARSAR